MKKVILSFLAVGLGFAFSAFSIIASNNTVVSLQTLVEKKYKKETNVFSWCVFEYVSGSQCDPNSYRKIPNASYIGGRCPSNGQLCAILAEEDLFNPGHPTIECLTFLLLTYGNGSFFQSEVYGVVEFKW